MKSFKVKKKTKKVAAVVDGSAVDENKTEALAIKDESHVESTGEGGSVGVSLGVTIPGPKQYSSVRVDVRMDIPLDATDEASGAYEAGKQWAEKRLQAALQELYSALE